MPIELYFPPLSGGVEQGLNNAGIETFEGEIVRHIVRECTQNALDAKGQVGTQVRVEIRLHTFGAADVPGLAAVRSAVESARSYWNHDLKTVEFCNKALSWTSDNHIPVLEVADYGTTGLEGAEGERTGSWFGLVQSSGVSNKSAGDAGGAYGIGKNAPYAGSFIRTVFYSTLNTAGQCAFQGVTKLTTHQNVSRQKTQDTGFIGLFDQQATECRAVHQHNDIPQQFRREHVGTSTFIIAYRNLGGEDWTTDYVRHAVENFWPAIHRGTLVFQIGDRRVDAAALPALMSQYSGDPDFVSRFYYRAVANQTRLEWTRDLPILGACRLYLVPGDATYPKKVCMTRQTGMVIYEASRFKSSRPFAGLFICESPEGNAYLRKLEPPRHHKWDPTRGDEPTEAKRTLQNIRDWLNGCLREINPRTNTTEAEVPELNRYLPDDEDEPLAEDTPSRNQGGGGEGFPVAPVSAPLVIQETPPRPPVQPRSTDSTAPGDGSEAGEGTGVGESEQQNGQRESARQRNPRRGGGATGPTNPHGTRKPLQTRSIQTGPGTYKLFLRSDASCSGKLALVSVGEDNKEDKDIKIARVVDLQTNQERQLEGLTFDQGQTIQLQVSIETTIPLSLRAYCHGD